MVKSVISGNSEVNTVAETPSVSQLNRLAVVVGGVALFLGFLIGYLTGFNKGTSQKLSGNITPKLTGQITQVPTATETPDINGLTPEPTSTAQKLSYTIPSDWKTYSKDFQKLHFSFSYPSQYEIFDGDPDSGNISLVKGDNYVLEIGRFSYYGVPEYTGGGRREWFINSANTVNSSTKYSSENYIFTPVDFVNGNSFYLVKAGKLADGQLPWPLIQGRDLFFSIMGGKSIILWNYNTIAKTDVYRIMQSLKVY